MNDRWQTADFGGQTAARAAGIRLANGSGRRSAGSRMFGASCSVFPTARCAFHTPCFSYG